MRGSSFLFQSLLFVSLLATPPLSGQTVAVSSTRAFYNSPMCFDQARGRLVVATEWRDLWEWDGVHWAKTASDLPFAPSHAIYDGSRQRVFFVAANRLHAYDGHGFVDHGPLPPGVDTFLVADEHRGRLVALGGPSPIVQTTYEWNEQGWQQVATLAGARFTQAIAYDIHRHVSVAQVSAVAGPGYETWEWDGSTWALRAINSQSRAPLGYDSVRQQVLSLQFVVSAWDGVSWTTLQGAQTPFYPRAVGNDPAHGRLWAIAESTASPGQPTLAAWNGTSWTAGLAVPHPESHDLPGFTYDSSRGRALLFGAAMGGATNLLDEWNGVRWQRLAPASGPAPRTLHAQVFDPLRGETLVFGGWDGTSLHGDTWAWNGSSWRLAATNGPQPRTSAAIAYDAGRGRIALVGGSDFLTIYTDHWEWDGSNWIQVAATTPMGQMPGSILGYDPLRARLVLAADLNGTWEYDGVTWTQAATTAPRPADTARALVWDPVRQRLQANLYDPLFQTLSRYEWDGVQWAVASTGIGQLAYDPARSAMLDFSIAELRTETALPATAMDFGAPCGGTTTPTSVTAFGRPRPGDATFHLDVRAEATLRPAVLGFAFAQGGQPLGNGCTLLLQNAVGSAIWFTAVNGCLHYPFALPNQPALRGVRIFVQAGVLDPASPGGFALSQGLRLVIGD